MAGTKEGAQKRMRSQVANQTAAQSDAEGLGGIGDTRDPNKEVKRRRVSMNKGQNLEVPGYAYDRENYYYRWIDEKPHRPGRLERAKGAFYEHCVDAQGNVISRPTGAGAIYLMRLPMKYRLEDLADKRAKVEKTLEDQTSLGENEYAPTKSSREGGKSSMVEKTSSENPYA